MKEIWSSEVAKEQKTGTEATRLVHGTRRVEVSKRHQPHGMCTHKACCLPSDA
ncbi:hypothetical protein LINGRAHAP2_LOCUS22991, partial [Linum grandiflorum]